MDKTTPAQTTERRASPSPERDAAAAALVSDGFGVRDADVPVEAPPPYGELPDQLQFSQAGFEAGAAVTDDGRVNININQKSRRLADLLAPTLRNQLLADAKGRPPSPSLPPAYIPPSLGGQPGQTPPPKLNVVIQIVGSRGDVQPFVALGKVLRDTYGHRVRVATHPIFQKFVEENGLEFFSVGGDPAELMAFMVKNPGLMPGLDALKSGEISKRRKGMEEILTGCWRSCIEPGNGLGPAPPSHAEDEPVDLIPLEVEVAADRRPFVADAIIANPPSFAHIHIAEKMGIPLHMMFTMPWSPTRAFPHPLANIQSSNTDEVMTNYVSYALVEMMTWQGLGDVINRFRDKALGLEPLSFIWAPGLLTRMQIPYTYCWSPALIPKPNDWGRHIDISGFYFLNLASNYTPEPELAAFLESGPPPVYIGFGSIVVDDPNAMTRMIFDAIHLAGVRALVSKGWGGLGADSVGLPEGVFMLGNVPHDWLFQYVSVVCHHGGAGTTAAGIHAGKPTIVVPFFGDQPFWGSMIQRAGAGPAPIPNKKLTAERLAEAIKFCMKPDTQDRAKELGEKIREEKGIDVGGKSFHDHLNMETLRCSIAPSRVAVWRVRRTQIKISGLAAAVLVREGMIKYTDLKLCRYRDYDTEGQPWDPISAVTASLIMDISGITMAIADLPRDLFKAVSRKKEGDESPATPAEGSLPLSDRESTRPSTAVTSDAASLHTLAMASSGAPSVSVMSPTQSTDQLGQIESVTSPISGTSTPATQPPKPAHRRESSSTSGVNIDLDQAVEAGKGVSRIVTTGVRSPMNFCLGLARGFRNVPRLYNDDTVRPQEKVTSLASGFKVAGKEFGFGMYDGLTGLVTQPLKGAEKEGGVGLLKGLGKGVGGLLLKPASAIWALPAYTMQGVHAEVKNVFSKGGHTHVVKSRIIEGMEQYREATVEERADVLRRWDSIKFDLKNFYALKYKEAKDGKGKEATSHNPDGPPPPDQQTLSPPKTGWIHTRGLSFEERKKLHAKKDAWKKSHIEATIPSPSPSSPSRSPGPSGQLDDEFERAIQASVHETSRGNAEEDARIEQAIRASLQQMQRSGQPLPGREPATPPALPPRNQPGQPGEDLEITDEEYQELIEKAIQQSLVMQAAGVRPDQIHRIVESDDEDEEYLHALQESKRVPSPLPSSNTIVGGKAIEAGSHDDDEALRRAIEESSKPPPYRAPGGVDDDEALRKAIEESSKTTHLRQEADDDELKRAIEASKSEHADQQRRDATAKTEEDIVLEYVKRQSLAEEEWRKQKAKGKMKQGEDAAGEGGEDEDEELKRALEESLKLSSSDGAGPSGPK